MAMSRSTRSRRTASLLGALLVGLFASACGGSDEDDATRSDRRGTHAEAVKLLHAAVAPGNRAARSGRVDGRVELTLKGVRALSEPFSVGVSGPYRYRRGASLPDYELEMGVRDNGVGLTSLEGRSWVSLGSTGYRLPAEIRRRLVRSSARGRNGLTRTLEQFGIAPWRWETDQQIAGTTRLDGVDVTHITTGFTAGRILEDANTLLGLMASLRLTRATGLPDVIPARARRIIVRSVTHKEGHQWVGVKDGAIHRSGFTMKFTIPMADRAKVGGISSGTVVGELNVTEVGRPQQISAPASIGSFPDFLQGVDAVGDAQGG
jgi:hypothetical protein